MTSLFFDTYALFEILFASENYTLYQDARIITTRLNLMELHYGLLRKYGKDVADICYERFLRFVVDLSDEIIKKANQFRLSFHERRLSYVDCIGYMLAQEYGVKFLTGDTAFQDLPFVAFVR